MSFDYAILDIDLEVSFAPDMDFSRSKGTLLNEDYSILDYISRLSLATFYIYGWFLTGFYSFFDMI